MKNTNETIHEWMKETIEPHWIAVDMTAGQGRDTLQMAKLAKHVYAVDIQEEAINLTKQLTSELDNITYIHDNHININYHVNEFVHLVIFNLGYLPSGNKKIKTNAESTLIALSKIFRWIRLNGYLIITCYRGHPGGKEEHETVLRWLDHQKNLEIEVLDYGHKNAPIAYLCKKISFDAR